MNSSKNLGGKKVQNSNGKPVKMRSKSVQQNLDNNLKKLTSQAPQKKITKTSGTTAKAKAKNTKLDEIKYTRSHKSSLFPHGDTFPWFLEDRKDDKRCWFVCYDHAEKYIRRYKLTKLQYKLVEQAS